MDYDVRLKSNGAYWQAWWYDVNGQIETKSLGAKVKVSRRQASSLCRELALQLRSTPALTAKSITLTEWLAKYRAGRAGLSQGTQENDRDTCNYLERYFDWDPPISKITRSDAADWRDALARGELSIDNAQHCRTPTETTVRNHVRRARAMFAEAASRDLVTINAFDRLKCTPPKIVKNWQYIGLDDARKLIDACPNHGWKALFALCRLAGLRRSEALDLTWQDISWDRNRILVNARITEETTKKRRREVPVELQHFPTGLTKILEDAFHAAREGAVLVCEGVQMANVDNEGPKMIKRAGLPPYSKPFHTLRKNLETDWRQHYPGYVVCEWLGHDEKVAREHYLHIPDQLWQGPKPLAQVVPNGLSTDRPGGKPPATQQ